MLKKACFCLSRGCPAPNSRCLRSAGAIRPAGKPRRIAALAAELLAAPERRRELGARAREFAERHHSPEAWAARLERVYGEAAEARRAQ